jgi:hypothetical protein
VRGKYLTRVVSGGVIFVGSITWATWALYKALRIGTCASGGPYVSARPCPAGTGAVILGLIVGIFGLLVGTAILASRGAERPSNANVGLLAWGLGFTLPCAGILVSIYGPASQGRADSKLGGLIVLVVFGLMGLVPLLMTLGRLFRFREKGPGRVAAFAPSSIPLAGAPRPVTIVSPPGSGTSAPKPAAPSSSASAATIEQLEQLADLKRSGALTEAEFEAAKRRILGSG